MPNECHAADRSWLEMRFIESNGEGQALAFLSYKSVIYNDWIAQTLLRKERRGCAEFYANYTVDHLIINSITSSSSKLHGRLHFISTNQSILSDSDFFGDVSRFKARFKELIEFRERLQRQVFEI